MTNYLLDTNIVSELTRASPHPGMVAWLREAGECYLSVLTIAELSRGAWLLRDRDAARAVRLESWIQELQNEYADRVLAVESHVAAAWARLPNHRTLPAIDSLIAATASAHDLTIVTRNIKDFVDLGVPVLDPFAQPS